MRQLSRSLPGITGGIFFLVPALILLQGSIYAEIPDAPDYRNAEIVQAYRARCDSIIDYYADRVNPDSLRRGGYFDIAAKLFRGKDTAYVEARLDSLMQHPRGSMFWMYPFITVTYTGDKMLPEVYKEKMHNLWRTNKVYRGDTENHWLLYFSSQYLAAQKYPGLPGSRWFNGKSSRENLEQARAYLYRWMNLTTSIGQGEYDSPHYIEEYLAPLALLYGFAEDPKMRRRARMMLDYEIADFAVENLDGFYAGAHSRIYPPEIVEPWKASSAKISWLLFGNTAFGPDGTAFLLAISGYTPPPILYQIATDRTAPYVHKEKKRTRRRLRNSEQMRPPVYKYTYMTPDYALGSSQGGLLQPIQQQTWGLIWAVDNPQDKHNTLFAHHPYSSPYEGTMYFAEPWHMVTELITRSKTQYDSPYKWTGGSPYEQVAQEKGALIALYNIPGGTRFPHINAFFSRDLRDLHVGPDGWIFARGGDVFIAYYPMAPYEWRKSRSEDYQLYSPITGSHIMLEKFTTDHKESDLMLYSPHLHNGLVLQTASAKDYADIQTFQEAVEDLPLAARTEPEPYVRFETLGGDTLEVTYGKNPVINGTVRDYSSWKLFDGPYLQSENASRILEMRHGPVRRTLDFNSLTIQKNIIQR